MNRNTLKVSYSCLPNISRIISSHNKKVLSNNQNPTTNDPACNCRKNNICPLQGNCLEKNVIYQCHIKSTINDPGKFYIGLTGNTFKDRWNTHKYTLRHEDATSHTQLSNYYWDLKRSGVTDPILSWEIIDQAASYKNGTKTCNLCLAEKFHIITSKRKLVNKKTELVSKCRHTNRFILKNYKSVPPDK